MERVEDPIMVAFDFPDGESLLRMADLLRGEVKTAKVGLETYSRMGPGVFELLRTRGYRIFADLKLHDIPNTVSGAVRGLVAVGAEMITVHACGGREMLRSAVEAARREAVDRGMAAPAILGVTVLTSLDEAALREIGYRGGIEDTVLSLAEMAVSCGLDGVVASAREVALLRDRLGPRPLIVTPGIRLAGDPAHDQARTATPAQALQAGADYLVVGRTVTASTQPRAALAEVRREAGL